MYLLDTCIVAAFQQAGEIEAFVEIATAVPIVLVEEVYDELTDPSRGKPERAREAKASLDGVVTVIGIVVGAPAAQTLAQLRKTRSSTKDLGEDASIALALHDDRLTFVTHEARAVFDAVESIAPRVLTLHPFLRHIVGHGAIDRSVACRISASILRAKKAEWRAPPAWCADWTAAAPLEPGPR